MKFSVTWNTSLWKGKAFSLQLIGFLLAYLFSIRPSYSQCIHKAAANIIESVDYNIRLPSADPPAGRCTKSSGRLRLSLQEQKKCFADTSVAVNLVLAHTSKDSNADTQTIPFTRAPKLSCYSWWLCKTISLVSCYDNVAKWKCSATFISAKNVYNICIVYVNLILFEECFLLSSWVCCSGFCWNIWSWLSSCFSSSSSWYWLKTWNFIGSYCNLPSGPHIYYQNEKS